MDDVLAARRPGGAIHRGMVWLLRHQTRWIVDVLVELKLLPARQYGIELLPTETWPVGEENRSRELRSDVVLRLWDGPVPVDPSLKVIRRSRVIGLILDVQLRRDPNKDLRVLEYDSAYPPVLGPNILFVVLTFREAIARWMREVLARKDLIMRSRVIVPGDIPRAGPIDAHTEPRRAVLEAMLHVRSDADLPLLTNALRALRSFEGNEYLILREMLSSQMKEPMIMRANEDLEPAVYDEEECEDWSDDYLTEDDRESFLYVRGERQGRLEGLQEGRAHSILDLLRLRAIPVDPTTEQRILACRDPQQFDAWLAGALTVTRADELFAPERAH